MPPVRRTHFVVWNYRQADFDGLRHTLPAVPRTMSDDVELDEALSMFYSFANAAIRDHATTLIPMKRFSLWLAREVRRTLKLEQAAFECMERHSGKELVTAGFAEAALVLNVCLVAARRNTLRVLWKSLSQIRNILSAC